MFVDCVLEYCCVDIPGPSSSPSVSVEMELAHTLSVEETLKFFDIDAKAGLSSKQVGDNQRKYGRNGLYYTFEPFVEY